MLKWVKKSIKHTSTTNIIVRNTQILAIVNIIYCSTGVQQTQIVDIISLTIKYWRHIIYWLFLIQKSDADILISVLNRNEQLIYLFKIIVNVRNIEYNGI